MSMGLHILDGSGSGRRCLLKGHSKSTFVRRGRETVSKRRTITRGGEGRKNVCFHDYLMFVPTIIFWFTVALYCIFLRTNIFEVHKNQYEVHNEVHKYQYYLLFIVSSSSFFSPDCLHVYMCGCIHVDSERNTSE